MQKKALISGGTGLIGMATRDQLERDGWEVWVLSRKPGERHIQWDIDVGQLDPAELEGFGAVIHLAGESIQGRWTEEKKERIRISRVTGTALLAERLAQTHDKPGVLVSASGMNFYGNQPKGELTENSPPGEGFLADVARDWEAETAPAEEAGIRVVHLRIAMVLSGEGGALEALAKVFKTGLGGPVGSGKQQVSWIERSDLARIIQFCIEHPELSGPVNACAPNPVTNRAFSKAVGHALGRPAVVPVPAFAVRGMFGELADETVLANQQGVPQKLLANGFEFSYSEIEQAVQHCLSA